MPKMQVTKRTPAQGPRMTTNEFMYALKTASDRLQEPYTDVTIELREPGVVVVGGVSQAVLDAVSPMLPVGARMERKLAS